MAHEIAKLLLEHAGSAIERTEAVRSAIYLGMPLAEVEVYLDWLDQMRGRQRYSSDGEKRAKKDGHPELP